MEVGSHTYSHADLTCETPARIARELIDSRTALEDILGHEITSFAYPYGRFNDDAVRLASECGYTAACTVRLGWVTVAQNPMLLPRVTVFASDTPATLARKIAFADNDLGWGRMLGYTMKRLAARIRGRR